MEGLGGVDGCSESPDTLREGTTTFDTGIDSSTECV